MKLLTVLLLLFSTALAQTPMPTPIPVQAVIIKASLGKIRAQLMADATEKHYEVKENTESKLVVQGKSEKRAEFKYGLMITRVGHIPDERIVYRFSQQDDAIKIEATTEIVVGDATGPYKKGEKNLKKQLAALKKQLEK